MRAKYQPVDIVFVYFWVDGLLNHIFNNNNNNTKIE